MTAESYTEYLNSIFGTKLVSSSGNTSHLYFRGTWFESWVAHQLFWQIFHDYLQFFQMNVGIVP
jgi:hypothetical protein